MDTRNQAVTVEYQWRYLKETRRHLIPIPHGPRSQAICGTTPAWYEPTGWRGTHTSEEYETLKALPACKKCLTKEPG